MYINGDPSTMVPTEHPTIMNLVGMPSPRITEAEIEAKYVIGICPLGCLTT